MLLITVTRLDLSVIPHRSPHRFVFGFMEQTFHVDRELKSGKNSLPYNQVRV